MKDNKPSGFKHYINPNGLEYNILLPESLDNSMYFKLVESLNKDYYDRVHSELENARKLDDLRKRFRVEVIELVGETTYNTLRKHITESRKKNRIPDSTEIGESYFKMLKRANEESQQTVYKILKDSGIEIDDLRELLKKHKEEASSIFIPKSQPDVMTMEIVEESDVPKEIVEDTLSQPIILKAPYDVRGGSGHAIIQRSSNSIWEYNDYFVGKTDKTGGWMGTEQDWRLFLAGDNDYIVSWNAVSLGSGIALNYTGSRKWDVWVKLRRRVAGFHYRITNEIGISDCGIYSQSAVGIAIHGLAQGLLKSFDSWKRNWWCNIIGVPSEYGTWSDHVVLEDNVRWFHLVTPSIPGPFMGIVEVGIDTYVRVLMDDVSVSTQTYDEWYLDEIKIVGFI